MSIKDAVARFVGGSTEPEDVDPTHVCESCEEEYYTDPELEIRECRSCGGVKVAAV